MRLINTLSLQFKEAEGKNIPKYAILSHRWGTIEEEVNYQDFKKGRKTKSPGYRKIEQFCHVARQDGFEYGWVDTCAIDKRSSAELSESINSMFAWYRDSERCYAYLEDVGSDMGWDSSVWWQRGWTLQELIAPSSVVFFNQSWDRIGSKAELAREIAVITGIPFMVLTHPLLYRHWTVAQKMSWAAGRQTSRTEDRAYSLLGLFNVNMPLLYGEGEKAFERLQLAIVQKFADESIFSWGTDIQAPHHVLAQSPDGFSGCFEMAPDRSPGSKYIRRRQPPRVSSWGIELSADAFELILHQPLRIGGHAQSTLWAVTLTTVWGGHMRELPCVIVLVCTSEEPYMYRRLQCLHGNLEPTLKQMSTWCHVGRVERDKVFHLQFDTDFV